MSKNKEPILEISNVINDSYLVNFDALFDTRLPILEKSYGREFSSLLINTHGYFSRTTDVYSDVLDDIKNTHELSSKYDQVKNQRIDDQLFFANWRKRKKEEIKGCYPTRIVSEFEELLKKSDEAKDLSPIKQNISLTINTAPYEFSEGEKQALIEGMKFRCPSFTNIETTYLPNEYLTPKLLASYTDWLVYDLNSWLMLNYQLLVDNPIPQVKISTPFRKIQKIDPLNNIGLTDEKIVAEAAKQLCGILSITYVDMSGFCIDLDFLDAHLELIKNLDKETAK